MTKVDSAIGKLKLKVLLSPYLPFVAAIFFSVILAALAVAKINSLARLSEERKQVEEELALLEEKSSKLGNLLSNQSVLKTNLSLVEAALPSSEDVPTLMTQIQQIATESGVQISTLNFGGQRRGKGGEEGKVAPRAFKKVSLQTEAQGSFVNLEAFLRNLERASRVVVVESLKFSLESEEEGENLLSTLGLASFYLDTPEEELLKRPLRLDISSPTLMRVVEKLKKLKIYESVVEVGGGGKEDPFAR